MNFKIKQLVRGAVIAAIYAIMCIVTQPIAFGMFQLRFAEALTLLPFLFPEAVWGVTLGCLLANIFNGNVFDIIFGTLATFLAAIVTRRTKSIWLAPLPPILFNAVIVGTVIAITSTDIVASFGVVATTCLSIGVSQSLVCYIIGIPLMSLVSKMKFLFK